MSLVTVMILSSMMLLVSCLPSVARARAQAVLPVSVFTIYGPVAHVKAINLTTEAAYSLKPGLLLTKKTALVFPDGTL